MHKLSSQEIKKFQNYIFDWYSENKRDLPWRNVPFDIYVQARDPYQILISEVMLQQTQVSRVIPKYTAWLEALPTVESLAKARVADVLRLWSGLGYNRRALNLKKVAEIIIMQYAGKFPQTEKQLLALPGIGQYTARALLCFAFNQQVAVVDTNVRRVILTQFQNLIHSASSGQDFKSQMSNNEMQVIADQLLPIGKAYEWNQALMDYASHVLQKEKILIPKQSKFIGSHRYYRGQVLKTLVEKKRVSIEELGELIKKDYEDAWLQSLISELRDEGFIMVEKNVVYLTS